MLKTILDRKNSQAGDLQKSARETETGRRNSRSPEARQVITANRAYVNLYGWGRAN